MKVHKYAQWQHSDELLHIFIGDHVSIYMIFILTIVRVLSLSGIGRTVFALFLTSTRYYHR